MTKRKPTIPISSVVLALLYALTFARNAFAQSGVEWVMLSNSNRGAIRFSVYEDKGGELGPAYTGIPVIAPGQTFYLVLSARLYDVSLQAVGNFDARIQFDPDLLSYVGPTEKKRFVFSSPWNFDYLVTPSFRQCGGGDFSRLSNGSIGLSGISTLRPCGEGFALASTGLHPLAILKFRARKTTPVTFFEFTAFALGKPFPAPVTSFHDSISERQLIVINDAPQTVNRSLLNTWDRVPSGQSEPGYALFRNPAYGWAMYGEAPFYENSSVLALKSAGSPGTSAENIRQREFTSVHLITGQFDKPPGYEALSMQPDGTWYLHYGYDKSPWVTYNWDTETRVGYWNTAGMKWENLLAGDVDGDAYDDIVARSGDGWWVSLSKPAHMLVTPGSGSQHVPYAMETTAAPWVRWPNVDTVPVLADLDGDGKKDLVAKVENRWWIGWSDGHSFDTQVYDFSPGVAWNRQFAVADIDGDGRKDLVAMTRGRWWIARCVGRGQFATLRGPVWSDNAVWQDPLIGDFDGNGKKDFAARSGTSWWVGFAHADGSYKGTLWARFPQSENWTSAEARAGSPQLPTQQELERGFDAIVMRNSAGEWWRAMSSLADRNIPNNDPYRAVVFNQSGVGCFSFPNMEIDSSGKAHYSQNWTDIEGMHRCE